MSTPNSELIAGRLVRLEAENISNLVAIDIPLPDDGVVCIGGKNGAGKSSVLNCIAMALGGAEAMPADPIRIGEETGKILLEFEGITIKLKLTLQDDKTVNRYLVIESKDGTKYNSPQALLATLTGKLAFDPLEFSMRKPKEQLAMLHKFLGIDLEPLAAERKKVYDERTIQNRFLAAAEQTAASSTVYPDVPDRLVDVADINKELTAALDNNRKHEALGAAAGVTLLKITERVREVKAAEEALKAAEDALAASVTAHDKARNEFSASKKINTEDIMTRLQTVQQTNAKITSNFAAAEAKERAVSISAVVHALTENLAGIDARKQKMLTEAEYPLDGMGVSDDEVLFQNIRFSQLNDATKIAVSCAMGLSLNPKLKIMLIRQGCHLDDEMLGVVRDMAKQAGALILVERVGEGKECKVIIADGAVKELRT